MEQKGEVMSWKWLCKIGIHKYTFIKFMNLYKGDQGMELKCDRCNKIRYDCGQPMM